jgi:hypothetical protein
MGRFTGPDQPFSDQYPADPQSWNLYGYVRNNPLKYVDLDGEDCVYTSGYSSTGQIGYQRGSCTEEGGTFFNGTIDENSFAVRNGSLEFSYTEPNGALDVHSMALPQAADGQLSPEVAGALREAGNRASRDTSTFMISSAAFATAYMGTYAIPAAIAGLIAMGETGAVGPGVELLNKIHHIFGDPGHNLADLVRQYGSPAAAYAALEKATASAVAAQGITGTFYNGISVSVGGTTVTVRGAVVDGVLKIGTAFK